MSEDEILKVAHAAFQHKMGTIMLQSGELQTDKRIAFVNRVVRRIRKETIAAELALKGKLPGVHPVRASNCQG